MAEFQQTLTLELRDFIDRQSIYFVASASQEGRINLSPKGLDSLRVIDDGTVAYLDVIGSGNETAAHLHENGRLTMMFCSFDDPPMILRLYGRGEVVPRSSQRFEDLLPRFTELPGARQLICLHLESLQTSCGYGVPRMKLLAERSQLPDWSRTTSPAELAAFQRKHNLRSIDGLDTFLVVGEGTARSPDASGA